MARRRSPDNPSCPHCGATHVIRNGHEDGRQRWVCRTCGRSFGPTFGTPMYRLRTPPGEVALREPAEELPHGRRYRRRTPAMAIGLADHVWSWEEFLTFRLYHYHKG